MRLGLTKLFACWVIFSKKSASADFSKMNVLKKKKIQNYHRSVEQIGSSSGPTFCMDLSVSKPFALARLAADGTSRQRVNLTLDLLSQRKSTFVNSEDPDQPA